MGAIKSAFENIGNGIKHAFEAVGEVVKSAVTLDFGGVAKGVGHLVGAAGEMARGAVGLTPAALAANTLFDGAIDKVMEKAQSMGQSVVNGVLTTVGNDLDMVKNGLGQTVHGLATGNFAEMGQGILNTGMGAVSVAEDFTPEGLTFNAAGSAVQTVVSGPIRV